MIAPVRHIHRKALWLLTASAIAWSSSVHATLISDFSTTNPLANLRLGDASWINDVTTINGIQIVGLQTAEHGGMGTAVFAAPLDLSSASSLALTASRINNDSTGLFRIILQSARGFSTRWDFTPSQFSNAPENLTDPNPSFFSTVLLPLSVGVQHGASGPADLSRVSLLMVGGDPGLPDARFRARFDNLSAITFNAAAAQPPAVPDSGGTLGGLLLAAMALGFAQRSDLRFTPVPLPLRRKP